VTTARVDLHIHTRYSERPRDWVLQKLSPTESHTDPECVYRQALERGMTYVTVTDRNRLEGSLLLKDKYPERCFTGVETTASFPEDGCKVNLLIFGITPAEFAEIDRLRSDIYELRDYLQAMDLTHSVAHALYSLNGRLSLESLEKLILLFNVFEGINGGRVRTNNQTWMKVLKNLTPRTMETLSRKHGIRPLGNDPWVKGFTGGSDDHSGLFGGTTWTEAPARSIDEFLRAVRAGEVRPGGRHNDYRSLAFTACKVAWDRSREASQRPLHSALDQLSSFVFERHKPGLLDRIRLATLTAQSRIRKDRLSELLAALAEQCFEHGRAPVEDKLGFAYGKITEISDEFTRGVLESLEQNLGGADPVHAAKGLLQFAPGVLLSLPFFTSLKHLHRERELTRELLDAHGGPAHPMGKRILWFTDTLSDLNGPSMTLQKVGWLAHEKGLQITIVTSLAPEEMQPGFPPNVVNLPYVKGYRLPFYKDYHLKVPSLLKSLEILTGHEPDEVYISTPGPVGLTGLLLSKLINARSIGVYHTDFTQQAAEIVTEDSLTPWIEGYTRWFYSRVDEIAVPTMEYIRILGRRGLDASRMRVFRRGIDSSHFSPQPGGRRLLLDRFGVEPGFRLLYAGRISKDKRLDLLADAFREFHAGNSGTSLTLAGDGPYLDTLRQSMAGMDRVHFLGRQGIDLLPQIYSGADLLVFPSTTDTFGMVILEAQACGLPALVSCVGGPKEIIEDRSSGWVVPDMTAGAWLRALQAAHDLYMKSPHIYLGFRRRARSRMIENHDWDPVLRGYVDGIGLASGDDDPATPSEPLPQRLSA